MKKLFKLLLAFSIMLTGCSSNKQKDSVDDTQESITVSNLVDKDSRNKLKEIMTEAGISDVRVEVFFNHVDQFNEISQDTLLEEPVNMNYTDSHYDEYDLQDLWTDTYPDFNGYNCRITAYELMGDYIHINNSTTPDSRNILLDLQSLEEDPSALLNDDDLNNFQILFSTVEGENTNDQQTQIDLVEKYWQDAGIKISSPDSMSLITVYFHANYDENDNELFIGHAGVLFDLQEDGLYFVEKLAFQAPYRFIHFDNREQLKDYLLERYASYYGENEAEPFILENGQLI